MSVFQVTSAARRRGAESCDSDDEDEEETDERRRERGGEENITQMAQPLGEPETSIPISEQLQVRTLKILYTLVHMHPTSTPSPP